VRWGVRNDSAAVVIDEEQGDGGAGYLALFQILRDSLIESGNKFLQPRGRARREIVLSRNLQGAADQ